MMMASGRFQAIMVSMLGLLTVLVQVTHVKSDFSVSPSDVTVHVGQSASFTCSPSLPTDTVNWYRYEPHVIIYNSGKNPPISNASSTKYAATKTNTIYNFTVKAASLGDGAPYSCVTQNGDDESYANLVVVDTPAITITPISQAPIAVGSVANISCFVNYGGPTKDDSTNPLSLSQDLQMTLTIGSDTYTSSSHGAVFIDLKTETARSKLLYTSRTLQLSDAGSYVICSVSSSAPVYKKTVQKIIPIAAKTKNVTIKYVNGTSSSLTTKNIGDVINCTADGYPQPTVTWTFSPQGGCSNTYGQKDSGWASLVVTCTGKNNWTCSASNEGRASGFIVFTVDESNKPAGQGFAASANWQHCLILFLASLRCMY